MLLNVITQDFSKEIFRHLQTTDLIQLTSISKGFQKKTIWNEIANRFGIFDKNISGYLNTLILRDIYIFSDGPKKRSIEYIPIMCYPATTLKKISKIVQSLKWSNNKHPETCKIIINESGEIIDYKNAGTELLLSLGNSSKKIIDRKTGITELPLDFVSIYNKATYYSYFKKEILVSETTLESILNQIRSRNLNKIGPFDFFSLHQTFHNDLCWKNIDELEHFSPEKKISSKTEIGRINSTSILILIKNQDEPDVEFVPESEYF